MRFSCKITIDIEADNLAAAYEVLGKAMMLASVVSTRHGGVVGCTSEGVSVTSPLNDTKHS